MGATANPVKGKMPKSQRSQYLSLKVQSGCCAHVKLDPSRRDFPSLAAVDETHEKAPR